MKRLIGIAAVMVALVLVVVGRMRCCSEGTELRIREDVVVHNPPGARFNTNVAPERVQ